MNCLQKLQKGHIQPFQNIFQGNCPKWLASASTLVLTFDQLLMNSHFCQNLDSILLQKLKNEDPDRNCIAEARVNSKSKLICLRQLSCQETWSSWIKWCRNQTMRRRKNRNLSVLRRLKDHQSYKREVTRKQIGIRTRRVLIHKPLHWKMWSARKRWELLGQPDTVIAQCKTTKRVSSWTTKRQGDKSRNCPTFLNQALTSKWDPVEFHQHLHSDHTVWGQSFHLQVQENR